MSHSALLSWIGMSDLVVHVGARVEAVASSMFAIADESESEVIGKATFPCACTHDQAEAAATSPGSAQSPPAMRVKPHFPCLVSLRAWFPRYSQLSHVAWR